MYYRSRYRPKRKFHPNKKVVIVLVAAVLIVVLTVVYGNALKRRVAEVEAGSTPVPDEVTVAPDALNVTGAAPALTACPLELTGLDAAGARTAADTLSTASYSGVSIRLTDGNGRPLYASSVVSMITADGDAATTLCDLKAVTDALHAEGLRAVGCFEVRSLAGEDATTLALRSYEIALICELRSLGIDEVLLSGLEVPTAEDASSLAYIEKIKDQEPDLTVGAVFDLASLKTGETEFEMLISRADYLAVALTLPPDDSITIGEWISGQITEGLAIFTRYAPRVVLPYVSDVVSGEEIAAVNENALNSWQIVRDATADTAPQADK